MTAVLSPALQEPTLLLERPRLDPEELIADVKSRRYRSLDADTPVCRFRGTLVTRRGDGLFVVGWQRNVARLQKMELSYPTIITLELDSQRRIRHAALDPCFKGSKGLLCHPPYLDDTLRRVLQDVAIDEGFFKKVQVGLLHCFHVVEVLGGIVSCLEVLDERKLPFLAEDEVADSYWLDKDLYTVGAQRMSHVPDIAHFGFVIHGASEHIRFDESGTVFATAPFPVDVFVNHRPVLHGEIAGARAVSVCQSIKILALEALGHLKPMFVDRAAANSFMCSNLFPQAFIGLLVQVLGMKMYHNNYNYVLHCLKGIQRFGGAPRCIGAVESIEEAATHFPRLDLAEVF
jgi:hypothetical protein